MTIEYADVTDWREIPIGTDIEVKSQRSDNFQRLYAEFSQTFLSGDGNVDISLLSYVKHNLTLHHKLTSHDPLVLSAGNNTVRNVLIEEAQLRIPLQSAAYLAAQILEIVAMKSPEIINSLENSSTVSVKLK
jgi:hypothetical protein